MHKLQYENAYYSYKNPGLKVCLHFMKINVAMQINLKRSLNLISLHSLIYFSFDFEMKYDLAIDVSSQSFCPVLKMASLCQIMHYRQTVINIQRGKLGCIGNKEKVTASVTPSPPIICKEALVQTGSVRLYLHINKKTHRFVACLQNPGSLFVMSSVCV